MWDRVQGWHERFAETDQGRIHDRSSDLYQDEAYAFFVTCFHLKDWLKNDASSAAVATDVEQFVANSPQPQGSCSSGHMSDAACQPASRTRRWQSTGIWLRRWVADSTQQGEGEPEGKAPGR